MKTKLTIGDTVRIKPHKIGRCKEKGCIGANNNYKKFISREGVIERIINNEIGVNVLGIVFNVDFSPCMLEKVEEKTYAGVKLNKKANKRVKKYFGETVKETNEEFNCGLCLKPMNHCICKNILLTPPQPKECIHEWRQLKEMTTYTYTGTGVGGGGNVCGVPYKFFCIRCLKIEYR